MILRFAVISFSLHVCGSGLILVPSLKEQYFPLYVSCGILRFLRLTSYPELELMHMFR